MSYVTFGKCFIPPYSGILKIIIDIYDYVWFTAISLAFVQHRKPFLIFHLFPQLLVFHQPHNPGFAKVI